MTTRRELTLGLALAPFALAAKKVSAAGITDVVQKPPFVQSVATTRSRAVKHLRRMPVCIRCS